MVTSGCRVTLPKSIRAHLGLRPCDKLRFTTQSDGRVISRPEARRLAQPAGMLTRSDQPNVSRVELLSLPGAEAVDRDPPQSAISCRKPE